VQSYSYYNPNFYNVRWKNLNINVVYLLSTAETDMAVALGYGSHNETFEVGPLSTGTVEVNVTVTASDDDLTRMCEGVSSARFKMTGEL